MEHIVYKCRRCETGFHGEAVPERYAQIKDVLLGNTSKESFPTSLVVPHLCDDGGLGLAEFVGRADNLLSPLPKVIP